MRGSCRQVRAGTSSTPARFRGAEREVSVAGQTSKVTAEFEQLGFQVSVLYPGVPACMYHGESDQEDFLVVSGECVAIVEGEERHLKQWDFVHCPPMTEHVFVGAGDGPCVIVMVGTRGGRHDHLSRQRGGGEARRERLEETPNPPEEAYAARPHRTERIRRYRGDGWLP